ncbi:hypothetical protein GCM10009839_52200 [Catenulispora yoronensis]|uniref:ABC-2 type transport system permease protein n=1 Tax=Catenulispora yoronensis TaxID=450799 RepID=A0ABP5GDR0_9ACTN
MTDLTAWRVEWLRLWRSHRLLALLAVFAFLGFSEPLAARYLPDLLRGSTGSRLTVTAVAPAVPADGVGGYASNSLQLGLVVVVVVAAFACTIDSRPALTVFYRTRVRSFAALLIPRAVVTACGAIAAYLVGLAAAWYETAVLIGGPDAGAMAASALLGSVYLAFAVVVTAAAGAFARSSLGTVGYALVVLLLLPLVGAIPRLGSWLPSALVRAPDALVRHSATAGHYQYAVVSAVLSGAVLLLAGCRVGARRETG